jgi:type VI secretion system protein VasG
MSQIDLNRLIRTLDGDLRVGLEGAASLAARHQHPSVDLVHWLRSLLDLASVASTFETLDVPSQALRIELEAALADIPRQTQEALSLSQNLLALAREG